MRKVKDLIMMMIYGELLKS